MEEYKYSYSNHEETEIDIREIIEIILKRKSLIIIITSLFILTATVLSYFILPPIYETTTTIMVMQGPDNKKAVIEEKGNLEDVVNNLSRIPQIALNTYINQVTSNIVLKEVIQKLKLDSKIYNPNSLSNMIKVSAIKDSDLIEIKVQNTDPKLATDMANSLTDVFIDYISQQNAKQMSKSVEILKVQLKQEQKNMNTAIKKLVAFQSKPRGVDVIKQELTTRINDVVVYQSQLQQLTIQYQKDLAGQTRLLSLIKTTPKTITLKKSLADDPEAVGVVFDRTDVNGTTQIISEEQNPDYRKVSQELLSKEVIIDETKRQITSLKKAITTLQSQIKSLQKEIATKETSLLTLQNDVNRYQTSYNLLQDKIVQTQISKSINLGERSLLVTSPAYKPVYPIKPQKMINIIIAAILGLIFSVLAVIIQEKFTLTSKKLNNSF